MIKLIINADDFGYSKVFNEKMLDLLERGFIKSTTVLIDRVTDSQAHQIRRLTALNEAGRISVGLHVDFDLEKPLLQQAKEQFEQFKKIFKVKPSRR